MTAGVSTITPLHPAIWSGPIRARCSREASSIRSCGWPSKTDRPISGYFVGAVGAEEVAGQGDAERPVHRVAPSRQGSPSTVAQRSSTTIRSGRGPA